MAEHRTDPSEMLMSASTGPGVYLMKDKTGEIIYVGKARNLKKRLSTYFSGSRKQDLKTAILVQQAVSFETILTNTENEALILESNIIKRHHPRYNVVLKDDKRYPVLRLDIQNPFPNLTIARKMQKDGALYFGPFSSSHAVRQTLNFIHKTFPIRKCRSREVKKRSRPCLHCQVQGCLAPCCQDVSRQEYGDILNEVILFLRGRTPDLIREIRKNMETAAKNQEFEKAARLRDKMFALETTLEKQVSVSADFLDRDAVGIFKGNEICCITLLMVRRGFLVGTQHFEVQQPLSAPEEVVSAFVKQYYETAPFIPSEILSPVDIEDSQAIEEWLRKEKGRKVEILRPVRGEKAKLVKLATKNAANAFQEKIKAISSGQHRLTALQKQLRLKAIPRRIECFDNSHIASSSPVSGMVVFENGKAKPSDYRTYVLEFSGMPNDYEFMKEVLFRRYGKNSPQDTLPELLIVDGGKGQLNIAVSILDELGLKNRIEMIAIAKRDPEKGEQSDKIYAVGRSNPVGFKTDSDLLTFLQRIRDEAHRFVLKFHRSRRGKQMVRSGLDDVPGIGPKRKKALMIHFGSLDAIKHAPLEALCKVPGMNRKAAEAIIKALNA
jgi:excinuclease ABC subunit C